MKNLIVTILALTLLTASAAYTQGRQEFLTASHSEKRVALVIGNGAYAIAPLKNTLNDAQDMAEALRGVGFEVIYRENLNQNDMKRAIREFGAKIRGGVVGLFYYAGHGVQVKGVNYLVPVGAQIESEEEVEYECIDAGFVLAQMESAGNSLNLMILDACRNNPFARSFRSVSRGLAVMDAPSGTLIAYATAPNSVASDGSGRNGVYTQELLKFMRVPDLSVEEVFKRVRVSVRALTQGAQTPWEASSLTGDFSFAGPAAAAKNAESPGTRPPQSARPDARPEKTQSSTAAAKDEQPAAANERQKVTVDGISFELQSCKLASATVTCQLLITDDSSEDVALYTHGNSQIVADNGDVYKVSAWQTGNASGGGWNNWIRTTLVSRVPTKAVFRFQRVSSIGDKLKLLRISFGDPFGPGRESYADFRDVVINER